MDVHGIEQKTQYIRLWQHRRYDSWFYKLVLVFSCDSKNTEYHQPYPLSILYLDGMKMRDVIQYFFEFVLHLT